MDASLVFDMKQVSIAMHPIAFSLTKIIRGGSTDSRLQPYHPAGQINVVTTLHAMIKGGFPNLHY